MEKETGQFLGDTACQKVPVKICGRGCVSQEEEEECHEKQVDSLVDVPEEVCDLNPQKTCHLVTKLVPSLKPKEECTTVPQETCQLKFINPTVERKPLRTEWCLDEEEEFIGNNNARNSAANGFEFQTTTLRSLPDPSLSNYQSPVRGELRL